MRWFWTILVLCVVYLGVFIQTTFDLTRQVLGAQIDLLPALVVYVSLTAKPGLIALVAVWGGVCLDSFSSNPLGVSIIPLFVVGLVIYGKRNLVLHQRFMARFILGAVAGAAVPILTLVLLLTGGHKPLLSWGSLWQLAVMSLGAGVLAPAFFNVFELLRGAFAYQPLGQPSFRPDREIRRDKALKLTG